MVILCPGAIVPADARVMAVERQGVSLCQVDESQLHRSTGNESELRTIAVAPSGEEELVSLGGDTVGDDGGAADAEGVEGEDGAGDAQGDTDTDARAASADIAGLAAPEHAPRPNVVLAGSTIQAGSFVAAVVTATGALIAYPHALAQVNNLPSPPKSTAFFTACGLPAWSPIISRHCRNRTREPFVKRQPEIKIDEVGSGGASDEGSTWDREQLLAGERALADVMVVKSARTLLSLQVNEAL